MALNFSHRPLFPGHLSEDSLVSPMRIANGYLVEGIPENVESCFDYGYGRDRSGTQDSMHKDILDILPSDPFGMDITNTFTAITGWLEDLEVDYGSYGRDHVSTSDGNYQLFAGLNYIWNNALRFQSFPTNMGFDKNNSFNASGEFEDVSCHVDGCLTDKEVEDESDQSDHASLGLACTVDDILSSGNEVTTSRDSDVVEGGREFHDSSWVGSDGDEGASDGAFAFALGYLGVRDLLVVESVCSSLRSTVRNDPLLWRSIHIDKPLSDNITDEILLQLTNRAQGNLHCLSLIDCQKITDDGLKRVLENNSRITKLSVPGCNKLSIDGIVNSLKAFKSMGAQGVKHLRIGGIYGMTQKHFEELNSLLGIDNHRQQNVYKPHFYHRQKQNFYVCCEDGRAIDIEICPRCQNLRLVYDCPLEGCQLKGQSTQSCRACTLCIFRCVQCGRCLKDGEYEETFFLDKICLSCWNQPLSCEEKQHSKVSLTKSPARESSCSFRMHG